MARSQFNYSTNGALTKKLDADFWSNKNSPKIKSWPWLKCCKKNPAPSVSELAALHDKQLPQNTTDNGDVLAACANLGFTINIVLQFANNPDFNVSDIWFSSAIQSLQHCMNARTTCELVSAVQKLFHKSSLQHSTGFVFLLEISGKNFQI